MQAKHNSCLSPNIAIGDTATLDTDWTSWCGEARSLAAGHALKVAKSRPEPGR